MVEISPTEDEADEKLSTIPKRKVSKKNKRKRKDFDLEGDSLG